MGGAPINVDGKAKDEPTAAGAVTTSEPTFRERVTRGRAAGAATGINATNNASRINSIPMSV